MRRSSSRPLYLVGDEYREEIESATFCASALTRRDSSVAAIPLSRSCPSSEGHSLALCRWVQVLRAPRRARRKDSPSWWCSGPSSRLVIERRWPNAATRREAHHYFTERLDSLPDLPIRRGTQHRSRLRWWTRDALERDRESDTFRPEYSPGFDAAVMLEGLETCERARCAGKTGALPRCEHQSAQFHQARRSAVSARGSGAPRGHEPVALCASLSRGPMRYLPWPPSICAASANSPQRIAASARDAQPKESSTTYSAPL
jgi:hypothetical protein